VPAVNLDSSIARRIPISGDDFMYGDCGEGTERYVNREPDEDFAGARGGPSTRTFM